jgi:flavin reductase (DIM6/NTAB) family NADH-FMN oxidoreductase RutF
MGFKAISPFELGENFFHEIGKQWMLITAAKPDGSVNSMTAAWGGIGFIWQQPVCFVFIRPQRCTKTFVEAASTLSLSFFDSAYRDALSFMGNVSGHDDAEKVEHSGLTLAFHETEVLREAPLGVEHLERESLSGVAREPLSDVARVERTPYFSEARLVLICERLYQQELQEECFLDRAQLERYYGHEGYECDLHTFYIVGLRHALVSA